ncbi:MAG: DUF6514 family protein [Firmicutes bacterium]|nr:DUF6514 family protein [Bacillota bacterium]
MDEERFYGKISLRGCENTEVEYYLIANSIGCGYCDLQSYGVKLIKTVKFSGGGKTVETKQINNIFYNINDAEMFLKTIIRNQVTPVALMDVVEDYIIDITKTA